MYWMSKSTASASARFWTTCWTRSMRSVHETSRQLLQLLIGWRHGRGGRHGRGSGPARIVAGVRNRNRVLELLGAACAGALIDAGSLRRKPSTRCGKEGRRFDGDRAWRSSTSPVSSGLRCGCVSRSSVPGVRCCCHRCRDCRPAAAHTLGLC